MGKNRSCEGLLLKNVFLFGWVLVAAIGVYVGAIVQDEGSRIAAFAAAACAAAVAVIELVGLLRHENRNSRTNAERQQPED